ncbi:putative Chaperone protein LppX [Desulfovibrionales bacterium]
MHISSLVPFGIWLLIFLLVYPDGIVAQSVPQLVQSTATIIAFPTFSHKGQFWIEPVTGMAFIWVPEGCYFMSCGSSEIYADERYVHKVCLDGFWLGKYEVTQGQWQMIMGDNPSFFKKGDSYPVENVSWVQAKAFLARLTERLGIDGWLGLPTEAEWEYACRESGSYMNYSGGENANALAWFKDNAGGTTHPVGTRAPNALGLYDMSGNVWEWIEDAYDKDAYEKHQLHNPLHEDGSRYRVLRSGSWNFREQDIKCCFRSFSDKENGVGALGFRAVLRPTRQQ